jgi:hypothetical protein
MVERAHRDNITKGSSQVARGGVKLGFSDNSKNTNFGLRNYEAKWTPPEGLFTKDAKTIAKTLKKLSKSEKQAMARLNFYINRGGRTLHNKVELEKAKKLLKKLYSQDVNMSDNSEYKYVVYLDSKDKFYRVTKESRKELYYNSKKVITFDSKESALENAEKLNEQLLKSKHYIRNGALIGGGLNLGYAALNAPRISKNIDNYGLGTALGGIAIGNAVDAGIGAGIGALVNRSKKNKMNKINEENKRYNYSENTMNTSYKDYLPKNFSKVEESTDNEITNFSEKSGVDSKDFNLEDKLNYLKNI